MLFEFYCTKWRTQYYHYEIVYWNHMLGKLAIRNYLELRHIPYERSNVAKNQPNGHRRHRYEDLYTVEMIKKGIKKNRLTT